MSGLLYTTLIEKMDRMKEKDIKPKAIILGYEKMQTLEEELGKNLLLLNRSDEEFIKSGASAQLGGVEIFVDNNTPHKLEILSEKTVFNLLKEFDGGGAE